jgi:Replication Fork Protection Component Swi3
MSFRGEHEGTFRQQVQGRRTFGSSIRMEERLNNSRNNYYSNDENDTDVDDGSDNEEERRLSELHGEADDSGRRNNGSNVEGSNVSNKKRKTGDGKDSTNIDDQYRQIIAKKNRVPRPKITVETLTGVDGLIGIPTEFTRAVRNSVPKNRKDIAGAAAFSRLLMRSYERMAHDLLPSSCPDDVYYKIEQLGSNKSCRDYIHHMRIQQRNVYLENVLGKDRANKIIDEFDDEIRIQSLALAQRQEEDNVTPSDDVNINHDDEMELDLLTNNEDNESSSPNENVGGNSIVPDSSSAGSEDESPTTDHPISGPTSAAVTPHIDKNSSSQQENVSKKNRRRVIEEDTDDEDESN